MSTVLSVSNLSKSYASGVQALHAVDLEIRRGEILALLGPNGAGKTTLINIICGIVTPSSGTVLVDGYDNVSAYREARRRIGLVPQELHTDAFESVMATVSFSRALFGCRKNPAYIEQLLKDLSLWEKRKTSIAELSGGMKRRVMIAKALSHEPEILFLDEPTAGVDVDLRRNMWAMVRALREQGVTIILTTHYIEEAEDMADRVGVIANGRLLQVDEKTSLMKRLGRKALTLTLSQPLDALPETLNDWSLSLSADGYELVYEFDTQAESTGVPSLLRRLSDLGVGFKDLRTEQSSLEDIFVNLIGNNRGQPR